MLQQVQQQVATDLLCFALPAVAVVLPAEGLPGLRPLLLMLRLVGLP